jgi:hypothetical protein
MSTFLDDYGAADARRERLRKRLLISLAVLVVVAGAAYFGFRNHSEKRQAHLFLDLLRARQYEQAYAVWGCTQAKPCPDYPYAKFLEDWGPQSPHADLSHLEIGSTRSCSQGIIQSLKFNANDEVYLWVARSDLSLTYAPWGPTCNPRYKQP